LKLAGISIATRDSEESDCETLEGLGRTGIRDGGAALAKFNTVVIAANVDISPENVAPANIVSPENVEPENGDRKAEMRSLFAIFDP